MCFKDVVKGYYGYYTLLYKAICASIWSHFTLVLTMPVESRYSFMNKYLVIYLFLCQVVTFVHTLHTPSKPDFYNGGSAEIAQLHLQDEHLKVL